MPEHKTNKKQASPEEHQKLKIRILKNGVHYKGFTYAQGYCLSIDANDAQQLEKLGFAKVIGI